MAATASTTTPNQRAHSMPLTTAKPATISRMPSSSQIQPQAARSLIEDDRLQVLGNVAVVLERPDRVEDLEDPADRPAATT